MVVKKYENFNWFFLGKMFYNFLLFNFEFFYKFLGILLVVFWSGFGYGVFRLSFDKNEGFCIEFNDS